MREASWLVQRHGTVTAEVDPNVPEQFQHTVRVWDEGREPFIVRSFTSDKTAQSFLKRVREESESKSKEQ